MGNGKADETEAALALFALWSGCAPPAPQGLLPAFALSGVVTSESALSLYQAASLLTDVRAACWLLAGGNDLSAPEAVLNVTVADAPPRLPPPSLAAETSVPFMIGPHLLPPDMRPEAPVLVFGGYQRLSTTPAMLREAGARFTLVGPTPRVCAGPADSPWAASLLPAPEREGFEWAIMLGVSIAYDPPWRRDAA